MTLRQRRAVALRNERMKTAGFTPIEHQVIRLDGGVLAASASTTHKGTGRHFQRTARGKSGVNHAFRRLCQDMQAYRVELRQH